MTFRTAAFVAVSALLATANGHITMEKPVPYSVDKIDSSPITAAGYPCKVQNGFTVSTMNKMAVGEQQQISFKGSAVHGGGSCQLSYTQDTTPTANSKFKVIKSIEGGCPGVDGVKSFDFTLPDSIPNGKGTFAWTWFAKLSGAPEMYMNCAPIDVSGGASDASKLDALPDMLIANIATTQCKSPLNKALKFPDPGAELQAGGTNDVEPPTGDCGKTGASPPANGPGAPAPSSGPSSAPASGPSATQPAAQPSTGGAAPTNPGGVFAPGASSTSTQTTLATVTAPAPGTGAPAAPTGGAPAAPTGGAPAAPTGGAPAAPTGGAPAAPTGGAPAAPTGGAPSSGGGSSCSENGAIVCNGPTQFGLCNNGSVVFMPVAAGTTCQNGAIQKRGYNGRIARPRAVGY